MRTKEITKERAKGTAVTERKNKGLRMPWGGTLGGIVVVPPRHPAPRPPPFPLPELPEFPFRHLAPHVFLSRDQPSHIRSGEEV